MLELTMDRFRGYSFSEILHTDQGFSLIATADVNKDAVIYRIRANEGGVVATFYTLKKAVKGFNELAKPT